MASFLGGGQRADVQLIVETIDKSTQAIKGIGLRWTELASFVGLAGQAFNAVSGVAQALYATLNEGAAIAATKATFDNLVKSVGDSDEAIRALTESTSGMVDQTTLLENANRFLSLGVAGNIEDLAELAEIGSQLGTAFGVGAAGGMEQLALIIANQSTPRLDSLGISADAVKTRIQELKEEGMEAGEAFTLATLEQGRLSLDKIGDQSDTTAGQLANMRSKTKDLTDALKIAVSDGLSPFIDHLHNTVQESEDSGEMVEGVTSILEEFSKGLVITSLRSEALIRAMEQLRFGALTPLSGQIALLVLAEEKYQELLIERTEATEENTAAVEEHNEALAATTEITDQQAAALERYEERLGTTTSALDIYLESVRENVPVNQELGDKVMQLNNHLSDSETFALQANQAFGLLATDGAAEVAGAFAEDSPLRINTSETNEAIKQVFRDAKEAVKQAIKLNELTEKMNRLGEIQIRLRLLADVPAWASGILENYVPDHPNPERPVGTYTPPEHEEGDPGGPQAPDDGRCAGPRHGRGSVHNHFYGPSQASAGAIAAAMAPRG